MEYEKSSKITVVFPYSAKGEDGELLDGDLLHEKQVECLKILDKELGRAGFETNFAEHEHYKDRRYSILVTKETAHGEKTEKRAISRDALDVLIENGLPADAPCIDAYEQPRLVWSSKKDIDEFFRFKIGKSLGKGEELRATSSSHYYAPQRYYNPPAKFEEFEDRLVLSFTYKRKTEGHPQWEKNKQRHRTKVKSLEKTFKSLLPSVNILVTAIECTYKPVGQTIACREE